MAQMPALRILVIRCGQRYVGGAEKMLIYFLEGLQRTRHQVVLGLDPRSRWVEDVPEEVERIDLVERESFSAVGLWRDGVRLAGRLRGKGVQMVHAWGARDWEIGSWVGYLLGCPVMGTLHDHPAAPHFSGKRRILMRLAARFGLRRIVCVSGAVRRECLNYGYQAKKLALIHNGMPGGPAVDRPPVDGVFKMGYLGVLTERKGIRALLEICDRLGAGNTGPWELDIWGEAQDSAAQNYLKRLSDAFQGREWWPRVKWRGWVREPTKVINGFDLLMVPSEQFDPFPNVVLEAGVAGVPVLAARVGGIPEMIVEGQTGWTYELGEWAAAAATVKELMRDRRRCREVGLEASRHVRGTFPLAKMVGEYVETYWRMVSNDSRT